jgi:hypothetical protein
MQVVIQNAGTDRGRRLYKVLRNGFVIFTGTLEEVKRFLSVRVEKIESRRALEESLLAEARKS